jgi:hypothetical protein
VEFGISWFLFFIPHSALYVPHFHRPSGPRNDMRLMIFARKALASGHKLAFSQKRKEQK